MLTDMYHLANVILLLQELRSISTLVILTMSRALSFGTCSGWDTLV